MAPGDEREQEAARTAERRARPQGGSWNPAEFAASLAFLDDLTGLLNRRLLTHVFEERWAELAARHREVSLIVIDLDGFKNVNDSHGHLFGDRVLKQVAEILKRHFREGDLVVRYGGDEFVVVLPGAGAADAAQLAQRAREAIDGHDFLGSAAGPRVALSFSMGVASCPADGPTGETVLARADAELYEEKRARRARRPLVELPPPAPARHRTSLGLIVGIAVALIGAVLALLGAAFGLRLALSPLPAPSVAPAPAPSPAPPVSAAKAAPGTSGAAAAAERAAAQVERARLEQQIRELERQVDRLTRALAARPRPAAPDSEAAVRGLQEQIQSLQERAEAGTAKAPTPGAASTPAPGARVRALQEQPLVSNEAAPASAAAPASPAAPAPEVVVTRPILLRFPRPAYPPMALSMQRQALVRLRVLVDERGRAVRAEPVGPPAGYGFDEAARQGALRAVYRPGMRDGVPTRMETLVQVRFDLGR